MIRKILRSGDPTLRELSKPVAEIDKKIALLVADLKDTLAIQKDPEGVGLAAVQIGKNFRIFVMNDGGNIKEVINPEVLGVSPSHQIAKKPRKGTIMEGCLSLPNYYGPLRRGKDIKLKYLDVKGQVHSEVFSGFSAQIVQHELDHLNGILFIDRLLEQKKPLYKLQGDQWEEVEI